MGHSPPGPLRTVTPNPQGAKFAWESAGSGLEVCPEDVYGTQEVHVNGAVVLAFQLYRHCTQVRRRCGPSCARLVWPPTPLGRSQYRHLEPSLHSQPLERMGTGKKCSDHWEPEPWVSRPRSALSSARTCSSSKRLVAGTWSVPWRSFGAAVWSGAQQRRSTT